jgi:hypothetical protein
MFNISQYLEKFKNIGQGERFLKEAVVSAIKEGLGISLETKVVSIKNGEVTLKVSPAVKNTIFIKKDLILEKIKEKVNQPVLNIR